MQNNLMHTQSEKRAPGRIACQCNTQNETNRFLTINKFDSELSLNNNKIISFVSKWDMEMCLSILRLFTKYFLIYSFK